jgi:hypothetical protein
MSNVLTFGTEGTTAARPENRMRRISRALAVVFQILLAVSLIWAAGAAIFSLFFPDHVLVGAHGADLMFGRKPYAKPGMVLFADQPLATRLAGIFDVLIATVPVAMTLFNLQGLFRLYAAGTVFARKNAQHLKNIGVWLLVYPFAKFAANMLFRAFGGTDHAWFSATLVQALLLGAVVFVIAQVMEIGEEIERERSEFV